MGGSFSDDADFETLGIKHGKYIDVKIIKGILGVIIGVMLVQITWAVLPYRSFPLPFKAQMSPQFCCYFIEVIFIVLNCYLGLCVFKHS